MTHGITLRAIGAPDPGEGGVVVVRPDPSQSRGYVLIGIIPPPVKFPSFRGQRGAVALFRALP